MDFFLINEITSTLKWLLMIILHEQKKKFFLLPFLFSLRCALFLIRKSFRLLETEKKYNLISNYSRSCMNAQMYPCLFLPFLFVELNFIWINFPCHVIIHMIVYNTILYEKCLWISLRTEKQKTGDKFA